MTPKHCLSAGQNLGGTVQLTMSFLHAHQIGSASMHPTLTACAQPRLIFGGSRSGRGRLGCCTLNWQLCRCKCNQYAESDWKDALNHRESCGFFDFCVSIMCPTDGRTLTFNSSRECNSGIPLLAHQRAYNRRSSCVVRAEADQVMPLCFITFSCLCLLLAYI